MEQAYKNEKASTSSKIEIKGEKWAFRSGVL